MAIQCPCPRCKHVTHMPDSAGGKIGRCKQCGAIVRIPLAAHQRKFCSVCRADVSQAKRVKDPAGAYYCPGCWQAKAEASAVGNDDFWNAVEGLGGR